MKKNLKCFICGTVGGIFISVNVNPICEECLKHSINTPHIEIPNGPTGPNGNPVIEITTTGPSSSTSSTTITIQPPGMV